MNSIRRGLELLAERYSERRKETQRPIPDKPLSDLPVTVPVLDPPDHQHRSVETRLWELEAAWDAGQSGHWQ